MTRASSYLYDPTWQPVDDRTVDGPAFDRCVDAMTEFGGGTASFSAYDDDDHLLGLRAVAAIGEVWVAVDVVRNDDGSFSAIFASKEIPGDTST